MIYRKKKLFRVSKVMRFGDFNRLIVHIGPSQLQTIPPKIYLMTLPNGDTSSHLYSTLNETLVTNIKIPISNKMVEFTV